MFYMEFILHEILKYKLNNLHELIFLHVLCFYFSCSILCRGFRKLGGGGGGEVRAIFKISRGG